MTVIYYGSFAKPEEQIPKIRCTVRAHHGTLDKRITQRVPAIPETMRANGKDYTPDIYEEIFPLVKSGGCFLNFERPQPPFEDYMIWLRQAGFVDVGCFWKDKS